MGVPFCPNWKAKKFLKNSWISCVIVCFKDKLMQCRKLMMNIKAFVSKRTTSKKKYKKNTVFPLPNNLIIPTDPQKREKMKKICKRQKFKNLFFIPVFSSLFCIMTKKKDKEKEKNATNSIKR